MWLAYAKQSVTGKTSELLVTWDVLYSASDMSLWSWPLPQPSDVTFKCMMPVFVVHLKPIQCCKHKAMRKVSCNQLEQCLRVDGLSGSCPKIDGTSQVAFSE